MTTDDRTFLYYVMPFVDGETLRQKLDREKQLSVDETVRIACAIATALDYAHRHDVIHRDIKPENVMLFEGQALVADFGIALAVSQAGGIVAVSVRDGSIRPVVSTSAHETSPALSPDERWLAFASNATGRLEVYVEAFPHGGERLTISLDGGVEPVWARDGSELYYRRGSAIMAVPLRAWTCFEVTGPAVQLFSGPYDFTQQGNWTAAPGGRLLMIKGDPAMSTRFQVVLNWYDELKAGRSGTP